MTSIHNDPTTSDHDSLDNLLDRGLSSRLTLVLGPDKSQRSKAINDWIDRQHHNVLIVDCHDTKNGRVCPQLILNAFSEAGIIDQHIIERECTDSYESDLVALINELATLHNDLVVVLSNYLPGDTADQTLSFLLEHLPQQVHIYLCCDSTPNLSCIPRLRVRRELQTIDTSNG